MREGREMSPEMEFGLDPKMKRLIEVSEQTDPSKEDEFVDRLRDLIVHWGGRAPENPAKPEAADENVAAKIAKLLESSGASEFSAIADREEIYSIVFDFLKTKEQEAVLRAFKHADLTDNEQRAALEENLGHIARNFSYPIEELYEHMRIGPEHGGNIVLD